MMSVFDAKILGKTLYQIFFFTMCSSANCRQRQLIRQVGAWAIDTFKE